MVRWVYTVPGRQHRTVLFVITSQIRDLQKHIRSVKNQYVKTKRLKKAESLLAKYGCLKERIGLLMQPLIDQANKEQPMKDLH